MLKVVNYLVVFAIWGAMYLIGPERILIFRSCHGYSSRCPLVYSMPA